MKIINKKISTLIPAEYNPRKLSSEQREQIGASLKRFGFVDPVIVNTHPDRMNIIIGGHMRTRVAKEELNMTTVPCVELSLSLDQERELNVRLNKNSGEWDFELLGDHFEIDELTEWGFDAEELDFFEVDEVEPPDLGDGEDAMIQTMTFTVSTDQQELIVDALSKAGEDLDCIDAINENSNGNKLAAICRRFLHD